MQKIIENNRTYITAIIKFYNGKGNCDRGDIIKEFYKRLLKDKRIEENKFYAKCLNLLLNHSGSKPGKIYVWSDNIVNFYNFIEGKTDVFSYYYPDESRPNILLWKVSVYYNNSTKMTEISKISCNKRKTHFYHLDEFRTALNL